MWANVDPSGLVHSRSLQPPRSASTLPARQATLFRRRSRSPRPKVWLLPVFSVVSRAAARVYYRLTITGGSVPTEGPVLLVANHPNSLFDPVLVVAASGRAVRFLAKAPLFSDPKVGWLVRGSGSIPVYRRKDDPTQMARNEEMFSAVRAALASGSAVALFPEGISHSEPGMTPLKTGAARIALGYAGEADATLPIVPVGLVLRAKDRFRSQAQVVVGRPVVWEDLADRGADDAEAVRDLTHRITGALHSVTVNLDAWEDQPIVECAVDVWEAELAPGSSPGQRVARLEAAAELLRAVRTGSQQDHQALVTAVRVHAERLRRLSLSPRDLSRDTSVSAAAEWTLRRLLWVSPPTLALGGLSILLFWVPYEATGWVADRLRPDLDQRSTYQLLVGIPTYGLWIAMLAAAAALVLPGWWWLLVLVGTPAVGMLGLRVRERWRGAWADARSYLFLRSRRRLVGELRERQRELASRLELVLQRHAASSE